jgi:hypothetical protein
MVRAVYINLKQRAIEYELTQGKLPIRKRVEYFPTLTNLMEKLPVTIDSFDLKLQGLKLRKDEWATARARDHAPRAATEDPWDLTNYFDNPRTEKPDVEHVVRLMEKKPK